MALELQKVDVWIGTALGHLKGASTQQKSTCSYRLPPPQEQTGHLGRANEIMVMCWDSDKSEDTLYLGHKDGRLSSFSTVDGQFSASCYITAEDSPGVPVGLERHGSTLITCLDTGTLCFWPDAGDKTEVVAGKDLFCMKGNPHEELQVATGGRESDLKLWDGNNLSSPLFHARNVRPDKLQLRVPVWVTQIGFVPPVESSSLVAVGTGHSHIRLYDIRARRRPLYSMEYGESPITALDCMANGRDLMVGTAKGRLARVDLRTGGVVNTFRDCAGCVRSVQTRSPAEDAGAGPPLMVACGLDRFLYVYDLHTRKLLCREYMKLEMNCLLLSSMSRQQKATKGSEMSSESTETEKAPLSEDSSDEDDVWNQLETVTGPAPAKKKKKLSAPAKTLKSTSSVKKIKRKRLTPLPTRS